MGMGAIVPSGTRLARAMAKALGPVSPGLVVELGAGTGRITAALIEKVAKQDDIVVVERDASFCDLLRKRFPDVRVLQGDARDMRQLTANAGVGAISHVVSGLPLLSMPRAVRNAIASEVFAALAPGGSFIQFTYGPRSPVPSETVAQEGFVARRDVWILGNFPPAAIWIYTRAAD